MKIASWNVRHVGTVVASKKDKRLNKCRWISHALQADVICVQESFGVLPLEGYELVIGLRRFLPGMKIT